MDGYTKRWVDMDADELQTWECEVASRLEDAKTEVTTQEQALTAIRAELARRIRGGTTVRKLAYYHREADGKVYVFEEPARDTAGWRRMNEEEYNKQKAAIRPAPTVSKLADIEAAVAEYQKWQTEYNRVFKVEPELATDYEKRIAYDSLHSEVMRLGRRVDWLTDLLAVVKAAQAMRAEIKNIPQAVMTYHMYDVVADYDKALTKLESEAQP